METLKFSEEEQKRYSAEFVEDVICLLQNKPHHDVELKCGDGIVFANKLLLACRSDYFKALFDFKNNQANNNSEKHYLSQFSKDLVQVVVDTLTHLDNEKIASVDGLELLEIADYLQMSALTKVAIKKISDQLSVANVLNVYKIAKKFSNLKLKGIENFMASHIFEIHETKNLNEVDKNDLDKIIEMRMVDIPFDLEESIQYVKNFYKLMKDLDRLDEFKNFVTNLGDPQGCIYFGLTLDKSILPLDFGHDMDITENMKINPESEIGKFLAPLCPRPMAKVDCDMKVLQRCWTHKYGDLSKIPGKNFVFGPEWEVSGDIQKIKFHITPVYYITKIICGLEITLKNGTVHRFGFTEAVNVEEFELEQMELVRLSICVDVGLQLILAIQVICLWGPQKISRGFIFPQEQPNLPHNLNQNGPRFQQEMLFFGPFYIREYGFGGIKGKTVMMDGKPIICELQVKYSKNEDVTTIQL